MIPIIAGIEGAMLRIDIPLEFIAFFPFSVNGIVSIDVDWRLVVIPTK